MFPNSLLALALAPIRPRINSKGTALLQYNTSLKMLFIGRIGTKEIRNKTRNKHAGLGCGVK